MRSGEFSTGFIGRKAQSVKSRITQLGAELSARAAEIYGDETPQDIVPIIYEHDLSNRTGRYIYKSSYWGRGEREGRVRPYYLRRYVFPLPILGPESSTRISSLGMPSLRPEEMPVGRFEAYVKHKMMGDQIAETVMKGNSLDVFLMYAADVEWRRTRPEGFYRQLGSLMTAIHPELPHCTVERVEQEPI